MQQWVLVVDDDEDVRQAIVDVLTYRGFRVDGLADGRLALEALQRAERLPALLVLDLEMPVMDGWQLIAALKGNARLAAIPYVIFSACGCGDERVTSLGAVACVPKGGSVQELVTVLERCTAHARHTRRARLF